MAIRFACPSPACGRSLTVSDEAAGRVGKCPGCGGPVTIPYRDEAGLDLDPETPTTAPAVPVPPEPKPKPKPADAAWADDAIGLTSAPAPVSFAAFGVAWGLLSARLGTWLVGSLLMYLTLFGLQLASSLFQFFISVAPDAGGIDPKLVASGALTLLGCMVQGVIQGAIYRLAIRQVDGEEITVRDLVRIDSAALRLAIGSVVLNLGLILGLILLIVPGLVFQGLTLFALPAISEGVGIRRALRGSFAALGPSWFRATVFALLSTLITYAGAMACGVGLLLTMPLAYLAVAVAYRRAFGPGGVPRPQVVADPWAEATGREPARGTESGRIPAWAWAVLLIGLAIPTALVGAQVSLFVRHTQRLLDEQRRQEFTPTIANTPARANPPTPPTPAPTVPPRVPPTDPVGQVREALARIRRGEPDRYHAVLDLERIPVVESERAAVVATLAPLVSEPRGNTGATACYALARWAGPDQVQTILAILEGGKARMPTVLFPALERLRPAEAIPVMIRMLGVPDYQGEASRVLLAIGPEAVPALRSSLTSDGLANRNEVIRLLHLLGVSDKELRAARTAPVPEPNAGPTPTPAARPGTSRAATRLAEALEMLEKTPPEDRGPILQRLSGLRVDPDARPKVVAAALASLRSPEPNTRQRALAALKTWGTAEQVPAVVAALDDDDDGVQRAAVSALGAFKDAGAALPLARHLDQPRVASVAAGVLMTMKPRDPEVEAAAIKALSSPDRNCRVAACQVLRAIGTPRCVPDLKRAATDSEITVVRAAERALDALAPSEKPETPPSRSESKSRGTPSPSPSPSRRPM